MKRQYDRRHHDRVHFDIGEVVVMLRQPTPGQSTKLQSKYRERPMQIIEVLPADTYRVAELTSDGTSVYATTAHTSQLKSWKVLHEDQSDQEGEEEPNEGQSDTSEEVGATGNGHDDLDPGVTVNGSERAKRSRRRPGHLQDYVLD